MLKNSKILCICLFNWEWWWLPPFQQMLKETKRLKASIVGSNSEGLHKGPKLQKEGMKGPEREGFGALF